MIRLNQNMVRIRRASRPVTVLCALVCATAQAQSSDPASAGPLAEPQSPEPTRLPTSTTLLPERATVTLQSLAHKRQRLLADSLSANAVWLDDSRRMLAFWYPGNNAASQGTMLVVHDTGHDSVWPDLLDNLVHHLPKNGWNLLTVAIPETFSTPQFLTRDAVEESSADPTQTIPAATAVATWDELLGMAYQWLAGRGITSIVLAGEGRGAEVAWIHIQEQEPSIPVVALVLINSPQAHLLNPAIPANAPSVKEIPTLDIFIEDFQWATTNAETRRRSLLQAGTTSYQQRRLVAVTFSGDQKKENRLTRYVRGFIAKTVEPR